MPRSDDPPQRVQKTPRPRYHERVMQRRLLCLAAILGGASGLMAQAPASQPADADPAIAVLREEERKRLSAMIQAQPSLGSVAVGDIVEFRVEQKQLVASTRLKPTPGLQAV